MTTTAAAPVTAKPKVRWKRVGLFYAIAFGWVCLVAAGLFVTGNRDLSGPVGLAPVTVAIALLYMPAPMVAAIIVQRLGGQPSGLRTVLHGLRGMLPRMLAVVSSLSVALMLVMLAGTWAAYTVVGLDGAGRILTGHEDLVANTLRLAGSMDASQVASLQAGLPPFWLLLPLALIGGLVAGFTINGLFALGEEFGWRGWLADELRPIGPFWANLLTGVLWGLWHTPLILLGFNYDGYGRLGPAFMIAFCVPLSFLLWRVREATGSVLGAAALHGAFNGFAGVFAIVLYDAHPLLGAPVGLIGAAAVAVVAAGFWFLTRRTRHV